MYYALGLFVLTYVLMLAAVIPAYIFFLLFYY